MSFMDLIEFRKEEGEVYLKGQRSLILNVDALGTLRKDLIHNLGHDRAKAFLVRYGWQLGYNDGINLMRNHDLDNEEELFKAGSVLFSMEGFARVQNDIVIADKETNTFLKKGKFFNSFEADQHLRHFGLSDKPVCWLLIGYASGYGSAFWGEKVYYVETKCKGNGDTHCEFEGRTLDDWGDSITSELSYYEDKTISEELNNAYKKIEDQNIQLERVLKTHQELSKLVLCGKGLKEITNNISRIIGHSVLLWDSNIDLLAFDQSIKEDRLDKIAKVFHKELYGNHLDNSAGSYDRNLVTDDLPLKKEVTIDNNSFWYALFPIISGKTTYGYITVLEEDTLKLDKESLVLVQRTIDIYAIEMMKQRQLSDLENRHRTSFVETLLNQTYATVDSIMERGKKLGQDILEPNYVMVLEIEDEGSPSNDKTNSLREALILSDSVLSKYNSSLAGTELDSRFVYLIPSNRMTKDFIFEGLRNLKSKLSKRNASMTAGIGDIARNVEGYMKSYQQANKSIRFINAFSKQERILFYEDMGAISLLMNTQDEESIIEFMSKKLKPIIDFDREYNSDLIMTLDHYLNTDSMRKTSADINLSLSGLKYRLNQIKDFGYDLQSPNEKFELQLALNIYKLTQ